MRRVLVSVEGQTEEIFVRDTLAPHLLDYGVALQHVILKTKRTAGQAPGRGGMSKWSLVARELRSLLTDSNAAAVTTMYDLYGLPTDTPGWQPSTGERADQRAGRIESEIRESFSDPRLRPYLQVHEFEALLFAVPDQVGEHSGKPALSSELAQIVDDAGGAEMVNDHPDRAPSKRLTSLWPEFTKTLDGPVILKRAGLQAIRDRCPHFDRWVTDLETLAYG